MFGLLGSSEELLDVLGDLLRLADDVLRAGHGGLLPALLPGPRRIGSWGRAAVKQNATAGNPIRDEPAAGLRLEGVSEGAPPPPVSLRSQSCVCVRSPRLLRFRAAGGGVTIAFLRHRLPLKTTALRRFRQTPVTKGGWERTGTSTEPPRAPGTRETRIMPFWKREQFTVPENER